MISRTINDYLKTGDIFAVRNIIANQVEELGSTLVIHKIAEVVDDYAAERWFLRNRILLEILEADELLGYDGNPLEILANLPDTKKFGNLQTNFVNSLIREVEIQISNGGNLHFFDLEKMETRLSATLLPLLIQMKSLEFLVEYRNVVSGSTIEHLSESGLKQLARTSYGFRILKNIHVQGPFSYYHNRNGLPEVFFALFSETEKLHQNSRMIDRTTSDQMTTLIDSLTDVMTGTPEESTWNIIFQMGYYDAIELTDRFLSLHESDNLSELDIGGYIGKIPRGEHSISFLYEAFENVPPNHSSKLQYARRILRLSYMDRELTLLALQTISDDDDEESIDAIVEYIKEESKKDPFMGYTTVGEYFYSIRNIFDPLLERAVQHQRVEIADSLFGLLDQIGIEVRGEWSDDHRLRRIVADALVRLIGKEAIPNLMEHSMLWYSNGFFPDDSICYSIISLGKSVIPAVEDYFFDDCGVNKAAVFILSRLCDGPALGRVLIRILRTNRFYLTDEDEEQIIPLIKENSPEKITEVILGLIGRRLLHDDNDRTTKWMEERRELIDESRLDALLSDDSTLVRDGACFYLSKYSVQSQSVIDALEILLEREPGNYHAVYAGISLANSLLIPNLLSSIILHLNEYPILAVAYDMSNLMVSIGLECIKLLKPYLFEGQKENRARAILLLGLVGSTSQGRDYIAIMKLDYILEYMYENDLNPTKSLRDDNFFDPESGWWEKIEQYSETL